MAKRTWVLDIGRHEVVVVIESGSRFRDLLVDGHSLVTGEQVSEKVSSSRAAIDQDTAALRCEQCGREGVPAIFTCPRRSSGDCPYVEQGREKERMPGWILFIIVSCFVVFGLCIFSASLITRSELWFGLGMGITLFTPLLVLVWLALKPIEVVQLYNANSGVWLRCRTPWGCEQSYEWAEHGEQVSIDLKLPRSLAYPPSVAALPPDLRKVTREEAVAIVRAALIGLLAQGRVQIYQYRFRQLGRGGVLKPSKDVYAVVGTRELDQAQLEGKLERQIKQVLTDWSKQRVADKLSDGPPISGLVLSLYDGDKPDPAKWLARSVADDAAAQGWGKLIGTWWKSFEWDVVHASQLQREREVIRGLSSQLLQSNPDFSHEMDREIAQGIELRVDD